ncbi:glucose-6-phosphate dehydrogenase [Beijerinckia indica]|uniref:Glucose-6-phosphate 1-dehydrogenase n=1 Tax=Beijerinckia indica subsp. indica (strain ATCC 9039 / DSM 1715 / NCIMB 8712) TaxID=395963 RepID=B2IE87_BEII9|nr:glucose-6-phosphate dehydrogenase [Beijerinckia indica]ACB94111.1 glucose-6-phosphate 1-dehydrogenase [Beijerinckia indica subsp. indica ATCC 9039]
MNGAAPRSPVSECSPETVTAPACVFVIFGASGDLTRRLLMPSLLNLAREGLLSSDFCIIGVDHHEKTDESFREAIVSTITKTSQAGAEKDEGATTADATALAFLRQRLYYHTGDFTDPATYAGLEKKLASLAGTMHGQAAQNPANAVFYLATAPRFFETIIAQLGASGLARQRDRAFRRIIIEKPFGRDLASARALNAAILHEVDEAQIYRIDHFLGKETVQNIMVLRFANFMFEPIWNRDHIDMIEITAAETVGVEGRGRFYETTGALRDMVPNHMFQLLSMIAMEPPNSFDADAIRTEKAKVIEAVRRYSPQEAMANAVRGQYGEGEILGQKITAYRASETVDPASMTETYAALKLWIDNWRWQGVPFFIRTGKALAHRRTEIVVHFKKAPGVLFRELDACDYSPGRMILHIQPDEGVSLRFVAKRPGRKVTLANVEMDFSYADYFKANPSTGYETLLYDCLIGDPTLFQRADNVEAGWAVVQPFLDGWADRELGTLSPLEIYPAGGEGPAKADALLAASGHAWRALESSHQS